MRAAVLRDGKLTVRETADPTPGPGQLLVRTLATALCASDVHFMDHPETIEGDPRYLYDPDRDIVMGHEFVGEIVAHGPDCTGDIPVGTRVTSMPVLLGDAGSKVIGQHPDSPGSFGELFLLTERMARAVADGPSDDAIAVVDAFAVGEFYVRSANLAPDEIPIVLGAGAVGLSAVAALASRGAGPIIVSDYSAERRKLAAQFGADVLVDPAERHPFEVWKELAIERGASREPVVIECVGAPGLMQSLIDLAPYRTRVYAAGGHYTGDHISVTAASQHGVTLQFGGGPQMEDWYGTLDAVVEGRLDPTPAIGMVVGLDGLPDALDLARRSEGPPRIVVHPWE
ncbi:MAG TPA: zinc-binding dehydrogenase [Acidimicrobiales bacterium]